MADHFPISIILHASATDERFCDPASLPTGMIKFHGINFDFGPDTGGRKALVLEPKSPGISVDATCRCGSIAFAHAVLGGDLFDGGPVGQTCASYALRFTDGSRHEVRVRQRFEIAPMPRRWDNHPIPLDWGQTPFLALPGRDQRLMPRTHGRYDDAGAWLVGIADPQSQVPYVLPYRYFIWIMENPSPEKEIVAIEFTPGCDTVVIGAITAIASKAHPFSQVVEEDLLLTLPGPVDETFGIAVSGGTASHLHPTVSGKGGNPGWGAPCTTSFSAYSRLTGSTTASAELTNGGDLPLARWRLDDIPESGALDLGGGYSIRRVNRHRTWLRITVRDQDTGAIMACRIHMRTAEGIPVAPYGHHAEINLGGGTWNLDIGGDVRLGALTYACIDGTCEGWVPEGPLIVELAAGFEYRPRKVVLDIVQGQERLELSLSRIADMASEGQIAGDTHVHFLSAQGAEHEARCEGLSVVNLLLSQWGRLFTSTEEFTGNTRQSTDGDIVVRVGQENRSNMLGHIHLLGLKRQVMPWCTGGEEEGEMGGGLETTLSHWADEAHAQDGLVVLAHFPVPNGEIAAMISTGRADAVETIAHDPYYLAEYYRYLNCGYRLPLVGGTDKMTAEVALGQVRTYAGAGEAEYSAWCDAIRRGDCQATSGPLLSLTVNGSNPGAELTVASGEKISIIVKARSIFPMRAIEIIVNGSVVHRQTSDRGAEILLAETDVQVTEPSWIAVRALPAKSFENHHDTWKRPVFAHTSPVYVRVGDCVRRYDEDTLRYMKALTDGVRLHVIQQSRRIWPGRARQRHGEADHLGYLLRPLDEALDQIHIRLATGR